MDQVSLSVVLLAFAFVLMTPLNDKKEGGLV